MARSVYIPLMPNYEYFPDGQIVVAHEVIDPELAAELGRAWIDMSVSPHSATTDPTSPSLIETKSQNLSDLQPGSTAEKIAKTVLGELFDEGVGRMLINRQDPGAIQRFHNDNKKRPVAVVQGSEGFYDYIPLGEDTGAYEPTDGWWGARFLYDPPHFETLETKPGDVVIQLDPKLIHRGRNELPGHPDGYLGHRYTAAIYPFIRDNQGR